MEEHIGKQEDEEGKAVENEDVGDVGYPRVRNELHLLFGGSHKKESGGIE
jgi:hypothetical protein